MDEKNILEQQMKLLQTVVQQQQAYIQVQDARMAEKDATIADLRKLVDELQSLKANLEETLNEFRRQFFGTVSEKTSPKEETAKKMPDQDKPKPIEVKSHIRERKPKAKRDDIYANLPIREIKIPLTDEQRWCEYCNLIYGFPVANALTSA